jgi:uracil-DNA glycosylase
MLLESPVPESEAPRDCPLCPRLVGLREQLRQALSRLVERAGARLRRPRAWLGIVGLAPGMFGANRTGRPFTGDFAGLLLYETLLKYGLAEGAYAERIDDGLGSRLRHPQLGQMPAARQQAAARGGRHLPALL